MADDNERDVEKNEGGTIETSNHSLTFDEKAIKKIVGFSTGEIPGILAMSGNLFAGLTDMLRSSEDPTKGITVEVTGNQVKVNMRVICEYGKNVPAIFQDIVDKVTNALKEMTGLDVIEVKVHVYDVLTKEDFDKQSKRKPEEPAEPETEEASE